jgi:UDP-glucose 4-epimerase
MSERYSWVNKAVLLTGGAGFIGSQLAEDLVEAGASVTIVDDLSTGRSANLALIMDRVVFFEQDIRKIRWEDVLGKKDYDVNFHFAANAYVPPSVERPQWDYDINLNGTMRLLEALRQGPWPGTLIYASSAAVYGNPTKIPIAETDLTIPISPYGVAKLAAERYVAVYSRLYGLRAASARFFSQFGPRQRKQVIYDFIQKLRRNPHEIFVHGDGSQVRDFNYVSDTTRAVMLIVEAGSLAGEVYNIASGRECSVRELLDIVSGLLNVRPKYVFSGQVRPGDPEKWSVDISKLEKLGYRPRVSLEEGLTKTVQWCHGDIE